MLNVKVTVLRGFKVLGTLSGQLDENQLPMHEQGETDPSKCVEALKGHLVKMEAAAGNGPLRMHVDLE